MKFVAFNARCPFEIGDKVVVEKTKSYATITDIVCQHFLKSGEIQFRYELNESGKYVLLEVKAKEDNQ